MAAIQWSLTAEEDIREIELYIARDSIHYAVHFVDSLIDAVQHLRHSPQMGRIVPEMNQDHIRELIFHSYRIVYLSEDNTVTILRVINAARQLGNIEVE